MGYVLDAIENLHLQVEVAIECYTHDQTPWGRVSDKDRRTINKMLTGDGHKCLRGIIWIDDHNLEFREMFTAVSKAIKAFMATMPYEIFETLRADPERWEYFILGLSSMAYKQASNNTNIPLLVTSVGEQLNYSASVTEGERLAKKCGFFNKLFSAEYKAFKLT